ncbi:MAG: class I SAM-dependent methyltransferase [Dehalococcoidales bacterium]|nr:MAG: class I SAM-dependent methyltransferase [Dehalococcoidales bacterium]
MASYVFMKILESAPARYDRGIEILSLGQNKRVQREIVDNYIDRGDRVLEIGCGTGSLAISCAEKGAFVVGIDVSSRMLTVASRKIHEHKLTEKVQLQELGAIEIDKVFEDGSFDKITGTLVFSELYPDERRYVLRQAYRILKPGGLIVIADEVIPSTLLKCVLHRLIRIPLAIITYILTQTTTRALKDFDKTLTETEFEIIQHKKSMLDSFALFVALKE